MVKAKDVYNLGLKGLGDFDLKSVMPALRLLNDGAMNDVMNINGCAYYQWTASLVKELNLKQIVELGGAMGVWTIMASHNLQPDANLYTITLEEHGLEYSYIVDKHPNVYTVIGNDLNLREWNKVINPPSPINKEINILYETSNKGIYRKILKRTH